MRRPRRNVLSNSDSDSEDYEPLPRLGTTQANELARPAVECQGIKGSAGPGLAVLQGLKSLQQVHNVLQKATQKDKDRLKADLSESRKVHMRCYDLFKKERDESKTLREKNGQLQADLQKLQAEKTALQAECEKAKAGDQAKKRKFKEAMDMAAEAFGADWEIRKRPCAESCGSPTTVSSNS
ncbi:hypothetical protein WJX73_002384 [Symbiochloris irregularis]|uniref:Uncharacterized protein n=1 Tax=Symbiochloris irregularis TaxID=706552 RepID=A0AAW1P4Q1_9CHLO